MSTSVSLEASASATPPVHKMNGGLSARPLLNVSSLSKPSTGSPCRAGFLDATGNSRSSTVQAFTSGEAASVYQLLASLALLCVLSLLMAFLALFFLQRVGPLQPWMGPGTGANGNSGESWQQQQQQQNRRRAVVTVDEYQTVYQVSVAMSTLTISLNLCCLFVCCIQFLFTIKLLKTPNGEQRTNKFIKRSSHTRVLAIAGFFLSIPIFFTGVILFTFIHFHELPAIITSIVIGLGIVFCGVASVHNVYLWQWEKTRATKELAESRALGPQPDLTHTLELSTLV
ncbi:uncharacterized protein LOC135389011 [Ornithodoros turicata]